MSCPSETRGRCESLDALVRSVAQATAELIAERLAEHRPANPGHTVMHSRHQLAETILVATRGAAEEDPDSEYAHLLSLIHPYCADRLGDTPA